MEHYFLLRFCLYKYLSPVQYTMNTMGIHKIQLSNSVAFKILMETLIKADVDLTAKTHALEHKVDGLEDNLNLTEAAYKQQLEEQQEKTVELETRMLSSQQAWQQKYEKQNSEISDLKDKLVSSTQAFQKHVKSLTERISELEGNLESNKQSFVDKFEGLRSEIAQYNASHLFIFPNHIRLPLLKM